MVFNFYWTKSFWIRSQKLLEVEVGAKNLDAWSWRRSPKFKLRLHSLVCHCYWL